MVVFLQRVGVGSEPTSPSRWRYEIPRANARYPIPKRIAPREAPDHSMNSFPLVCPDNQAMMEKRRTQDQTVIADEVARRRPASYMVKAPAR